MATHTWTFGKRPRRFGDDAHEYFFFPIRLLDARSLASVFYLWVKDNSNFGVHSVENHFFFV